MSPTARSLKKLRDEGCLVDIVERRAGGRLHDLFGFLDLLCITADGDVLGIQTTSGSNVSARIKKITNHQNVGRVRDANIGIHVHGWRKAKGKWICRTVDLS
jgi:hypothetical protein